jgi:hypothetical protein
MIPSSRALAALVCKHGWQLALIEAPTAINLLVPLSSCILDDLLSDPIDGDRS